MDPLWVAATTYRGQQIQLCARTYAEATRSGTAFSIVLSGWMSGGAWAEHLPWVLIGVRAAPKEDFMVSSTEVVFRLPLLVPGHHG